MWLAICACALLAFALGVAGVLLAKLSVPNEPPSLSADILLDAIYFSLRLFRLDYDFVGDFSDPYPSNNWMLQIARVLAPATLLYAVFKGVTAAAASWLNLWRISRWTDHAVVCGGGERGRGIALALCGEGRKVVVIECNPDCKFLADIRKAKARVLFGDATDPKTQRDARLSRAAIVAAVLPSEENNLEIALAAADRHDNRPLRALVHAGRVFSDVFESSSLNSYLQVHSRLIFFDHNVVAARRLLWDYAPRLVPLLLEKRRSPRILVAGDTEFLPELIGLIISQCQFASDDGVSIIVSAPTNMAIGRSHPLNHPDISLVADITLREAPSEEFANASLTGFSDWEFGDAIDLAFVACEEDAVTLNLAKNLSQRVDCSLGEIVACLRPSTRLLELLNDTVIENVVACDLVKIGCNADIILQERLDEVAKEIHEEYLKHQERAGLKLGQLPSLVLWEQLPETLRRANRSQADHRVVKLRTLEMSQTEEVRELLAKAEHRRWTAERIMAGWRFSDKRDDKRRLHPDIRPYSELSEEAKQKDRSAVDKVLSEMGKP